MPTDSPPGPPIAALPMCRKVTGVSEKRGWPASFFTPTFCCSLFGLPHREGHCFVLLSHSQVRGLTSCRALRDSERGAGVPGAVSRLQPRAEAGREACIPPRRPRPHPRSFLLWTWPLLRLTFASPAVSWPAQMSPPLRDPSGAVCPPFQLCSPLHEQCGVAVSTRQLPALWA